MPRDRAGAVGALGIRRFQPHQDAGVANGAAELFRELHLQRQGRQPDLGQHERRQLTTGL